MSLFHPLSGHGRLFAGREKLWLAGAAAAIVSLVFAATLMRGSLVPLTLTQPSSNPPRTATQPLSTPSPTAVGTASITAQGYAATGTIAVDGSKAVPAAAAGTQALAATAGGAGGAAPLAGSHAHHQHHARRPGFVAGHKPLLPGATLSPANTAGNNAASLTPAATAEPAAVPIVKATPTAATTTAASTLAAAGTEASKVFSEPVPEHPAPPTDGQLRMGPVVIAHRGASGVWPEHSREAYIEGVHQGSDFIECDVVLTKDLVPICRHDPNLSNSTNAATVFPAKVTTRVVDGVQATGVFAADLTWEEVKQLEAKQPWPFRDQYKRVGRPVSFDEYLHLAQSFVPPAGVYPEVKSPSWHNALPEVVANKTSIEDIMLHALRKRGYVGPINSPHWVHKMVYIQSFDAASLKRLKQRTCIPLIQLLEGNPKDKMPDGRTVEEYTSDKVLAEVASYAVGIGPGKQLLVDWKGEVRGYESSGVVERAHAAQLQVHPYTLRSEEQFVLPHLGGLVRNEMELLLIKLRVDGIFADYPDSVVAFLRERLEAEVDYNMTLANTPRTCHLKGGSG